MSSFDDALDEALMAADRDETEVYLSVIEAESERTRRHLGLDEEELSDE